MCRSISFILQSVLDSTLIRNISVVCNQNILFDMDSLRHHLRDDLLGYIHNKKQELSIEGFSCEVLSDVVNVS